MKTTLTLAAALLCGTAALAQTTTPPTTSDTPAGTTATGSASSGSDANQMPMDAGAQTGATAPAADDQSSGSATTASGATSGETAADAAATSGAVASTGAAVGAMDASASATPAAAATGSQTASLSGFDTNNDGALTPMEFAQMWAKSAGGQAAIAEQAARERASKKSNNAAVDLLNQTAAAFGKADTSRDMRVTPDELAAWQASGSPTA